MFFNPIITPFDPIIKSRFGIKQNSSEVINPIITARELRTLYLDISMNVSTYNQSELETAKEKVVALYEKLSNSDSPYNPQMRIDLDKLCKRLNKRYVHLQNKTSADSATYTSPFLPSRNIPLTTIVSEKGPLFLKDCPPDIKDNQPLKVAKVKINSETVSLRYQKLRDNISQLNLNEILSARNELDLINEEILNNSSLPQEEKNKLFREGRQLRGLLRQREELISAPIQGTVQDRVLKFHADLKKQIPNIVEPNEFQKQKENIISYIHELDDDISILVKQKKVLRSLLIELKTLLGKRFEDENPKTSEDENPKTSSEKIVVEDLSKDTLPEPTPLQRISNVFHSIFDTLGRIFTSY